MYLSHTNKKAPVETIASTGAFINKKTPVEEDFNRSYQLYGIALGELHRRKIYNYKLNILCTLFFVNQFFEDVKLLKTLPRYRIYLQSFL